MRKSLILLNVDNKGADQPVLLIINPVIPSYYLNSIIYVPSFYTRKVLRLILASEQARLFQNHPKVIKHFYAQFQFKLLRAVPELIRGGGRKALFYRPPTP